jgi:hypothetical protein
VGVALLVTASINLFSIKFLSRFSQTGYITIAFFIIKLI